MANGNITDALRFPSYRRVFALQVTVRIAKYLAQASIGAAIYCATNSAAILGLQAATALTMAACSVPVAGWLMTRWAPRQIIRIGLGSLIFVLAMACVLSIGGTTASWLMLGAAGCIAATTGCVGATLQALETTSVPNEVRQSAISIASLASGIPRVFGLAIGAAVGVTFSAGVCFAIVVAILVIALMLPVNCVPEGSCASATGSRTPLHDVATGVSAGIGDKRMRPMLLVLGLTMIALLPIESQLPALLSACSGDLAFYLGALAIGGIIGGPSFGYLASRQPGSLVSIGLTLGIVGVGLLALLAGSLWAAIPMLLLGLSWELVWCSVRCAAQTGLDENNGQAVLRLMTMACSLVPAAGSLLLGLVVESLSAQVGLLLCGSLLLGSCLVRRRPRTHEGDVPSHVPAPRVQVEELTPVRI